MSRTTSAVAASTIGIDTGKHTLHLIGLDEQGMIVLREKLARGRERLLTAQPDYRGLRVKLRRWRKRSRRRIRDLVTRPASQGLSENEIGCARISEMSAVWSLSKELCCKTLVETAVEP
jgi:hypothetical protein